ncbi:hypothetical protein J437_LFUL012696 [Ladona fulva]|uniref:Nose resistant-to-fluoxetine protein N-terminal domain-containing protein n=1 Tax=Ladona fulva TaxID=123851 RepID=A0A8K0JZP7_LADFU|nr:hypothetical protein J437_LFUL012696 [Ladona fulva]
MEAVWSEQKRYGVMPRRSFRLPGCPQTWLYDATGRYSSQFTFGNGFWLGSKTLCLELDNMALKRKAAERKKLEATKIVFSSEKHPVDFTTQPPNDDEDQKERKTKGDDTTSVSPLFPVRQQNPFLVASKSPPYRVRFFIARIELSLTNDILMRPRQVLLGVCMPRSCTPRAISQLIDISVTEKGYNQSSKTDDLNRSGRSIKVLHVRPVPGDYDWKMDPKVYVLGDNHIP